MATASYYMFLKKVVFSAPPQFVHVLYPKTKWSLLLETSLHSSRLLSCTNLTAFVAPSPTMELRISSFTPKRTIFTPFAAMALFTAYLIPLVRLVGSWVLTQAWISLGFASTRLAFIQLRSASAIWVSSLKLW